MFCQITFWFTSRNHINHIQKEMEGVHCVLTDKISAANLFVTFDQTSFML